MRQPSTTDLALIAAKLDPKLPPDEAATRARAIWEALDRHIRADEIADTQEGEQVRAECERRERFGLGLRCDRISLSDAYKVAVEIAHRLGKKAYHNEKSFAVAMRKAKLTIVNPIYGKSIEEWVKSAEPERPIVGTEEYTSAKAVEELYRLKAEQRQSLDRKRKAAAKSKKRASKESEKSSAERKRRKAERRNNPLDVQAQLGGTRNAKSGTLEQQVTAPVKK